MSINFFSPNIPSNFTSFYIILIYALIVQMEAILPARSSCVSGWLINMPRRQMAEVRPAEILRKLNLALVRRIYHSYPTLLPLPGRELRYITQCSNITRQIVCHRERQSRWKEADVIQECDWATLQYLSKSGNPSHGSQSYC